MQKNTFELQVLVNGRPVREAYFQGRAFIEARKGTQYTLKLKNTSHRRAVAVFSVDGIDVLHGKKAEEADGGYIVDAYSSIEVKGFRVDDDTVSAFKFDHKNNSYANKIGAKVDGAMEKGTENCGVIGVRVTYEKQTFIFRKSIPDYKDGWPDIFPTHPAYPTTPTWTCSTNIVGGNVTRSLNADSADKASLSLSYGSSPASSCNCSVESPDLSMGTSWGEKIEDAVKTVSFEKSNETTELVIFYGERDELERYGVEFNPLKKVASWPKPFGSKYCPIP